MYRVPLLSNGRGVSQGAVRAWRGLKHHHRHVARYVLAARMVVEDLMEVTEGIGRIEMSRTQCGSAGLRFS